MIDQNDKQTASLALEETPGKRKRGRPSTGQAISRAEIQRKYRERKNETRREIPGDPIEKNNLMIELIRHLQGQVKDLELRLGREIIARKEADSRLEDERTIAKSRKKGNA
ncbi:hypothetical protein KDL27_05720 [Pseudomonas syringae pv. syringae]|uniref:Uncharacterized protein n=1 Tax=Pseudomonas syringae pv. syringae TaxID=321 RepID=A0AB35JLI7_PSESY|nr:hypothetical protein [Pseudomonas syringae]MDC3735271.1 hypothetical protein [Pseudomonas syringae pv. syringae]MDC3735280.1 hypothetical protein [Pseudomonas syringae pv. syringae]